MKLLQSILVDSEDEILEGSYPIGTIFVLPTVNEKYRVVRSLDKLSTVNNTTIKKLIASKSVISDTSAGSAETGASIAAKLFAEPNTNNFDDLHQTKLNNLFQPSPTDVKADYEKNLDTNAFTDAEKLALAGLMKAPVTQADVKKLYELNPDTNAFTDALRVKLMAITALTNAQIKSRYELNPDTYVFNKAMRDKLIALNVLTNLDFKANYEANGDTNTLTDALYKKLNSIQDGATNLKNFEIKALLESNPDTHTLTDAEVVLINEAIPED